MILFLATFLSMYGGIHCYVYVRFKRSFSFSQNTSLLISAWFFLITLAPVLVRLCEENGFDLIAKSIAWPGFIWMGFIFILVSILFTLDIISLAAHLLTRRKNSSLPYLLRPDITVEISLLLAIIFTIYGLVDAGRIRTEHISITTDKLNSATSKVRIVQISDVHLGLIIRENRLQDMLKAVNDAGPDILVSTGDLIDGRLSRQEGITSYNKMAAMLAAIPAPFGKFAVTGNHEFYAGLQQSLEITNAAGFKILRNEFISLPNGIAISGIDDSAWKQANLPPPAVDENRLLKSLPARQFRLHLKHRPLVPPDCDGLFDLQLSGHTHHGQIFPFYLLTKIQFPIPGGTTTLKSGSKIHVSNGTGTWGPPIRFMAPPEITVIDIFYGAKSAI